MYSGEKWSELNYAGFREGSAGHLKLPTKTCLDKWSLHPYHWSPTYPLKMRETELHYVLGPAICLVIHCRSHPCYTRDYYAPGALSKNDMRDTRAQSLLSTNTTSGEQLRCLFQLEAILTCFHCRPHAPYFEQHARRGSGSAGGQEVERGHSAVKCLNVASFPFFNWAI